MGELEGWFHLLSLLWPGIEDDYRVCYSFRDGDDYVELVDNGWLGDDYFTQYTSYCSHTKPMIKWIHDCAQVRLVDRQAGSV